MALQQLVGSDAVKLKRAVARAAATPKPALNNRRCASRSRWLDRFSRCGPHQPQSNSGGGSRGERNACPKFPAERTPAAPCTTLPSCAFSRTLVPAPPTAGRCNFPAQTSSAQKKTASRLRLVVFLVNPIKRPCDCCCGANAGPIIPALVGVIFRCASGGRSGGWRHSARD